MADTIYNSGELIFTKGDQSDFAYVIKTGEVEILDNFPDTPFRLAVLSDGDIFGEMGLVDERPRVLTARAISETRVAKISRSEFVDLILHKPEEAFRYLRMFFERLRAMNMRVSHDGKASQPKIAGKHDFAVTLMPKTPATNAIVPAKGVEIKRFPFRVGRSSSRSDDPLEVNDLILPDTPPYNVSRNHFSIEKSGDRILIHDRGSFLGTIVNGKTIGGHHHAASTELKEGENEIVAGSHHSPFRFRIIVSKK